MQAKDARQSRHRTTLSCINIAILGTSTRVFQSGDLR